jgi:hypothetical protein
MTLTLWTAVPLTASADGIHEGFMYTLSDGNATITGYTGTDVATITGLDIPSSVSVTEGGTAYPVTVIAANAFAPNAAVTTIKIPETVTAIAATAANSFPATLTTFIVDEHNPVYSSAGGVLFNKNKTTLLCYPRAKTDLSYTIPDSVTVIESSAFFQAKNFQTIVIPGSVITIKSWALAQTNLTGVIIPDSVTSIGASAFSNCTNLRSATIPGSVKTIGNNAFQRCGNLGNGGTFTIGEGVEAIGDGAFLSCWYASGMIPASVKTIGSQAFGDRRNTTNLTILGTDTVVANDMLARATGYTPALTAWCYNDADASVKALPSPITINIMIGKIKLSETELILNTTNNTSAALASPTISSPTSVATGTLELLPSAITWHSSNEAAATVASGVITAVNPGTALITATVTTHSGDKTASVPVTVTTSGTPTSTLTMKNGTAIGTGPFAANAKVSITANDVEGQEFVEWTSSNGGSFVSVGSATTAFVMPANGTTVTATYRYVTPKAKIDYTNEKLTGLNAEGVYWFNGSQGVAAADGTYEIPASWMNDSPLSIVKKGDEDGTGANSSPQTITIPAKPAVPTGISKEDETTGGQHDGKINGLNAAMEYRAGTNGSWIDIAGTEIAGLMPGSYQVRYKATGNAFASQPSTVTIAAGTPVTPQTYGVTVVGGTDGANGTYAEGATVNITANAPASGKVFDTWTTTDGVTFANANSASTSFVMPAKAVTVTATYKDATVNPPEPPAEDNGWVYENGVWKYFASGVAKTGWIYDQNKWYFTNAAGEMQTGWIYDQSKWYYLAGNGAMKTGWVQTDGSWYYLSGNGAMIASQWFHDADGNWYYLSGNGKMLTGKHKIGGKAYTFKSNGAWVG